MHVQIHISGDKDTIKRLQKMGDKLTRLKPELNQIGDELETYFGGQTFASQGGILGKKWARLNPGYARWKARSFPGRPMLVKTGKMMSGFRHTATETSLRIYNRMPYFKYHQSSAPRSKIPYRPTMGINSDVTKIIQHIIQKGVKKRIEANL